MIVLVTGSVYWTDPGMIEVELDARLAKAPDVEILTGMAEGADAFAREWAERNGVPLKAEVLGPGRYPEPMHLYNEEMLSCEPDVVLAFKDGIDLEGNPEAGTEHMCLIAAAAGVPVRLFSS